ncbi:MAG: hypothetical protein CFK52_00555 [Chloracidobacterium sp. CP2_5A]|nr:MAG: hypothetical protein CFK52_00555 [Chloracidobacterium sp. CP2_5A]
MESDPQRSASMRIRIPPRTLVALAGASGSGKTTFARRHFAPTEVLSSDAFRALVADDESDQSATEDAFDALYFIAARRLARGKLVVVDATHSQAAARARLRAFAAAHSVEILLIVFDLPLDHCLAGNASRSARQVPSAAVERQHAALRQARLGLAAEGFVSVIRLETPESLDAVVVEREPALDAGSPASQSGD